MTDEDRFVSQVSISADDFSQSGSAKQDKYLQVDNSVYHEIARSDAQNRIVVSRWVMWVFGAVNFVTIAFIIWLAFSDQVEIAAKLVPPADRVVNSQVIISLLGATTVQLGTIALIMARYVFKAPG